MEPEISLPPSQVPANCRYPKQPRSSPCPKSKFLKINLNIIFTSTTSVPVKFCLSFRLQQQNNSVYKSLLSHTYCMPPLPQSSRFLHPIIFCEVYRSFNSSLCNLLHSIVNSSHLCPNILLSPHFFNTLSLHSSLNLSDQVSHTY
jgi:hypothetical protein